MPARALRICRQPGCGVACAGSFCDAHKRQNVATNASRDRLRALRAEGVRRLYDTAQWRKRTVPHVLARDPFCKIGEICGGAAISTDVDHEVPAAIYIEQHGGDARYFYDERNLRGACHADHSRKTGRERRELAAAAEG